MDQLSSLLDSLNQVASPEQVAPQRKIIAYQPGRAYHSTHEDRRDFAAARALWGIERRLGTHQSGARQEILADLFFDLGE
jgi:hypothetical protein